MDKRIKQVSRGIVVMAVCVSALLAFASDCRTKVETFLGSPSKVNYLQLVDSQGTTAQRHRVIAGRSLQTIVRTVIRSLDL
jgi:hypothetical protein